ncbi:MAG: VPLPA-CTERM sorting domain-containing protein [Planctomycetota bacterium]
MRQAILCRLPWKASMKPLTVIAAILVAFAAQAAPVTVTSLAEFNTVIGGASTSTETFDNDIPGRVSITFDNGTTSTLSGGSLDFAASDNVVSGGMFQGTVDGGGSDGALLLTLDFGAPVIGFGADFTSGGNSDLIGEDNSAVEFSVDDGVTFFDLTDVLGASEGFLGVLDPTAPFQTVQFRSNSTSVDDGSFGVDNLVLASDTAAVPVPASALLLAAAFGGLGVLRRRSLQQS